MSATGRSTSRLGPPESILSVATAFERRIGELEQLASVQSRELKIQFERIAQLQAEWDILRHRVVKS